MKYIIESDAIQGSPADSWADFAEQLASWIETSQEEGEFEASARAFAARAVMLAGGETGSND